MTQKRRSKGERNLGSSTFNFPSFSEKEERNEEKEGVVDLTLASEEGGERPKRTRRYEGVVRSLISPWNILKKRKKYKLKREQQERRKGGRDKEKKKKKEKI